MIKSRASKKNLELENQADKDKKNNRNLLNQFNTLKKENQNLLDKNKILKDLIIENVEKNYQKSIISPRKNLS